MAVTVARRTVVIALLAFAVLAATSVAVISPSAGAATAERVTPQVLCDPDLSGSVAGSVSGGFHTMTPERLLDTRISTGPVQAGCTAIVDLMSYVGDGATGVALDVASVDAAAAGFVTVFPCDASRPLASSLNPRPGDTTPNSVVVPLGTSRRVCLYSSVSTQLVVDLSGWFGPGGSSYHGLTPEPWREKCGPSIRRSPARFRWAPVA